MQSMPTLPPTKVPDARATITRGGPEPRSITRGGPEPRLDEAGASRVALPIDPLLPGLVDRLRARRAIVLTAEPAAGKTTRVPRAILESGDVAGEVLVLEPRRLAARLAAERVAEESGERVGGLVGYVTRFERAMSKATRLVFMTEGILTRRLLADPQLEGVSAVVLDEFHERHLATDVSLAFLRGLQRGVRPDLRIVVMSATIDPAPLTAYLDAEAMAAEGRVHPVEIVHAERSDDRPVASKVKSALFDLTQAGLDGDVLVFLPGAREIRLAQEACAPLAREHDLLVLPLHGSLPVREQDLAVRRNAKRKVILSTNVAETSVTIDGVVAVIDSGLAQIAECAPWSGLSTLRLAKISRASATQRAGRAGRTRPGKCLRLYTSGDLATRPARDTPEISRLDLAEPVLELVAQGVGDPAAFAWFEPPPPAALAGAIELLRRLGAVTRSEAGLAVTETGTRMLAFPVHPRQARLIVEAERRGVAEDGCAMAALIGERSLYLPSADARRSTPERSDLVAMLDELQDAEHASMDACRARGIDKTRAASALRVHAQLKRIARDAGPRPASPRAHEDALLIAGLSGYPDRVGRLRRPETRSGRAGIEVVFASGGSAALAESSRVREADLVIAVDAEERVDAGRSRTVVRVASAVEPDWLLDLYTADVVDEELVTMPAASRRVEAVRVLRYGALVLEETRGPPQDLDKAAAVLADAVLSRGLSSDDKGALERLAARVSLLRQHMPALSFEPFDPSDLRPVVVRACEGKLTLDELEGVDWAELATARFSAAQRRALAELAPEKVELPGGRAVRVEYGAAAPPSIASRLQDFFGMADGPRIVGGRVPLVLHLCAPNQRPVQLTTDLSGFWTRHYPAIAKELRRRYPRHAWPDDPAHAQPPAVTRSTKR